MSETYLSTGTMAWPGEPETDFNIKIPVWEQLSLPFGPQYSADLGLQLPPSLRAEREAEAARAAAAALLSASKEDEDDDDSSNNADEYYAIFGGKPDTDSDIEEFYKNFDKAESSSEEGTCGFCCMNHNFCIIYYFYYYYCCCYILSLKVSNEYIHFVLSYHLQ